MINARIIVEPNFKTKFPRNVTKEVTTKVKRVAPRIKTRVTEEIRIAVREALVATPEYQSILQGKLRAQLGIPDPNTPITSETPAIRHNIMEPRSVTDGMYLFNSASTGLFDLLNPGI